MKKGFALGLIVGLLIAGITIVYANTQIQAILNDQIRIQLDGEVQIMRDETTHELQYPITYHDRTYLPLRTIANLVGVVVDYDASTKTAILKTLQYEKKEKEEQQTEQQQQQNTSENVTTMKNDLSLLKYMTKKENYMVSPFSLKMAMLLAANGAEGTTQSEILNTFGIHDIKEYNQLAKELIANYKENEFVKLNVANSIWLNSTIAGRNVQFAKEYQDLIANYFDGTAHVEDENQIAPKANKWIEEKTNGKIRNVLNENQAADYLALLINTIYFKGEWASKFEEYATYKETFTDRNSKQSEIDFMHQTSRFGYYEDSKMKMVKLPYRGLNTTMYVVLPNTEEELNLLEARKNMSTYKVRLSLPKFKTEYFLSFSDILQTLGVKEAFDQNNAKFKNVMFKGMNLIQNVYIGDVIQKTFIEVNETGTEAAAATVVIAKTNSALPQQEEIKEFKADRPFIYFIMDENTEQVLFMGEFAYAQ